MNESLPATVDLIARGTASGLHSGAQVCVSRDGTVVADLVVGEASPGVDMRPTSLTSWMSSGKPLLAVAMAQLVERGQIDLQDRVVDHVPEFGANGKDGIDLRHLLTHTSGLTNDRPSASTWDELVGAICASSPVTEWVPGAAAGYNVGNGWVILAEVLRRVDGRDYDQYAREEILLPLGMEDSWVHLKGAALEEYGDRVAGLYDTASGGATDPEWTSWPNEIYWPGGSARGPVRELTRFYEMLLRGGSRDNSRIVGAATVAAFTGRHRSGMVDKTFGYILDWGLGFMVDSKRHGRRDYAYSFGEHASDNSYGHGGYQSSMGFADPDCGLAVAWTLNGMPGERAHRSRNHDINTAIYEDLGLKAE